MEQPTLAETETILITGASSGIGAGFARAFADRGQAILLTARRADRLEALRTELAGRARVEILPLDIADPSAPARIGEFCAERGLQIAGLVNNAGHGWQAGLANSPVERVDVMIAVNIAALVRLTRWALPGMLERGEGFVINLGSTAAFQPVPYFSVYAASKAFVLSFSEALAEEVRGSGVRVVCLCPGPVDTEFQKVAGMSPRFFARSQSVDEVVRAGMRALRSGRVVARTSCFQAFFSSLVSFLPRAAVRRLAALLMRASGGR